MRSILKSRSDADIAQAVTYGKRIKLYPLTQAARPPQTTFVDAVDVVFDGVIPYDVRFFESLNRIVQVEPWLERDRAMIDPLKSLGIEQGKPFTPDQKTTDIFAAAGAEAVAWFDARYETGYEPYNSGSRWFFPADENYVKAVQTGFSQTDLYPTDARGTLYYFVYSSVKHPGAGQYLPVRHPRQGRQPAGRCVYVSPSRAAKAPGETVLVGRALRLRHACVDSQHAACEQVVAIAWAPDQRRWLGGRVLRAEGA